MEMQKFQEKVTYQTLSQICSFKVQNLSCKHKKEQQYDFLAQKVGTVSSSLHN